MGILSHFKNLYIEAFANCKPEIVVILLKAYSVFCAGMLLLAFYAFTVRIFDGFKF